MQLSSHLTQVPTCVSLIAQQIVRVAQALRLVLNVCKDTTCQRMELVLSVRLLPVLHARRME